MRKSVGEQVFTIVDYILLILISLSILAPMLHIFSMSVSSASAVNAQKVGLWPIGFNLDAYKDLIGRALFKTSLVNTVFLTTIYTILAILINTMAATGLSKDFYGKKFLNYVFVITMYFGGGLIPTYILIANTLKLNNTFAAYILPALVNVFYMIVIRSQIEAIPQSLPEAAQIDGANEYQVLIHIIMPAISPTIAAVSMFLALGMWNMWYSVLLYGNSTDKWTLQYLLRSIIFEKLVESEYGSGTKAMNLSESNVSAYNYQMAAIITVAAPIICIYPFVQKYFVKGILTGSVKE